MKGFVYKMYVALLSWLSEAVEQSRKGIWNSMHTEVPYLP